ncbi:MAG: hypothetical protein FWF41_08140 [Betaproteobacteria bacterium]|nr:hypothetical protein [Betaproteobacteria bacterium]
MARPQRGIVLLVTLLVLVAMMLVSVGIMRSVDTSIMAVDNMAFRQAAEASANQALEMAVRSLNGAALIGTATESNVATLGYFASFNPANDDARGLPVNRLITATGAQDANSGNITRTVIERMCTAAGAPIPPTVTCLMDGSASGSNKINMANEAQDDLNGSGNSGSGGSMLYRISVRVDGPNGTVTHAQAMVVRP